MEILFYSGFQKRENSTKQPAIANPTITLTGYLREPSSMMNPVFNIKRLSSDASPVSYTYAYIMEFERFYYVKDWVWNDGVWECHLSVDVLASFKAGIFNTDAYIERTSNTAYQNGAIIDKLYPATTNLNIEAIPVTPAWQESGLTGADCFFVIGVIGKNSSSTTGVKYYAMTPTQMYNMSYYLMSTSFYSDAGFGTAGEPLTVVSAKAMYNPLQYITSCFYFHIRRTSLTNLGSAENIQFGPYDIPTSRNITGYPFNTIAPIYEDFVDVSLSDLIHPQAPTRGKYLNYSPYTRALLFYPPFGTFPVDPSWFEIGDTMLLRNYIDFATGKGRLDIVVKHIDGQTTHRYPIAQHECLFGVPIQLNQVSVDYLKAASAVSTGAIGAVMGLAGIASGNPLLMYAGGAMALNSIGNSIESFVPELVTQGTNGSWISLKAQSGIEIRHAIVVDEDNADCGRPSCQVARISQIATTPPQYIKCAEVHVAFPCFEEEKKEVTKYMLGGFFAE